MKVYFPAYYKGFKCIADKCRHSCCIGWEIGVDADTMDKYLGMDGELGEDIRSHLNSEESVISMQEDGRCPFLDNCGLCRIISAIGEENTSRICQEHPRFYHRALDRIEGGIGASCEEACRIVLSSDCFDEFVEVTSSAEPSFETDFDGISHRNYIFSFLRDAKIPLADIIKTIRERYDIPSLGEISWDEAFDSLEYLDESKAGSFSVGGRDPREESQKLITRFLAYLVYRHVSVSENYDDLRARIGFCLLLAAVFENSLSKIDYNFDIAVEIARTISGEIEYSEDNTSSLIMEMWSII